MAVVVFDPAAFKLAYPEFSGFSNTPLTQNFDMATLYLNNTDASVVQDVDVRGMLLNLLTAHITKLFLGTNNGVTSTAPSDVVGRVSLAKEGTVQVHTEMGPPSMSAAWYNQTRYGAMYWAATVRYRTARYVPLSATTGMNPNTGYTPAIWPWGRWS